MNRSAGSRGIFVIVAAVLAVAAGAVLLSQPRERAVITPASAGDLSRETQAEGPSPAAAVTAGPERPVALRSLHSEPALPAVAGRPPEAASSRPRSPLERSPGYYPPDDPESMSVVTGRREAPLVDLEFRGSAVSSRDLALQLLSALHARDQKALDALRVTREEFEVVLWPELPESRPITNISVADGWEMSQTRSISSGGRAVGSYGGRPLEFLRVEASAVVPYKNFTLHRGITITARDNASGEVLAMNFASSFVERRGRFKVVLYRD